MISKVLPVPYFTQPTSDTCQSTSLKMFASYLEGTVVLVNTGAGERPILDIWKDINEDPKRLVKVRNAHLNMKWWLEKHFPGFKFSYLPIHDEGQAIERTTSFINQGLPVLMSVSHANVAGHIVVVIGYEDYVPLTSSADLKLVVHDPNGRFDPSLKSPLLGKRRRQGGTSLLAGGESAPGRGTRLAISGVSRHRAGDKAAGIYYLLSATR